MSQSTKRKYVTKEVLDEFKLPEKDQKVVQVVAGRGNNLHQVLDPSAESGDKKYLVSMPTKFRKNVWIKRGDFVMVEPIKEGDKVKAEIVQILYKDQIKFIKKEGLWPNFEEPDRRPPAPETREPESDDDSGLFRNTNRPEIRREETSESEESEED